MIKLLKRYISITENIEFSPLNSKILTLRINYDNRTLQHIESILEDIKDIDRKKVKIHFERVWQTKHMVNKEQMKQLNRAIKLCIINGFIAGHGIFGNRNVSCPAETLQYAVINYDGLVYRCNGRNLLKETNEGYLNENGEIVWDENKLTNRLGKTTFENLMCLNCIMLPQCMGPCSQKNIENNWKSLKNVCSLNAIDVPLKEYIISDFKAKYFHEKNRRDK